MGESFSEYCAGLSLGNEAREIGLEQDWKTEVDFVRPNNSEASWDIRLVFLLVSGIFIPKSHVAANPSAFPDPLSSCEKAIGMLLK